MLIQQFFVGGLAHASYLLAGAKTCAVIDPRRDIGVYLDAAKAMGVRITHVLETHLHADFVSGHLDLAEKTGAAVYAPRSGNCSFKHVPLSEGDRFELEDMEIRVLETPGHTPEHIGYVVVDHSRGEDPAAVFTGDTLFVGDVGRPDLFPGMAKDLASKLFDSLAKLGRLPDFCEVYPAHGAGSLCGRAMAAKRTSTIGYERKYNYAFDVKERESFIDLLTHEMPAAPDHFGRCSDINRKGPALARDLPPLLPLPPEEFALKMKGPDVHVLDIRGYDAFGGHHVPGAWHIDFGSNFSTFAGWVLPPQASFLLVAETPAQAGEASVLLRRVGLDRAIGLLEGGMYEWAKAGLPGDHVAQLSAGELARRMADGPAMCLVDVRAKKEFQTGHIEGALNIPAPELRTRHGELDSRLPVVVVCNTGHRSSLGASILNQKGFNDVSNLAGGMTGYTAAGLGVECKVCAVPHGPSPRDKP
jgi:hydroxyacylglutathione hydrolase